MTDIIPPTYGVTRSPELNELATALAKAQMAMEGARKDKTNPHFKAAYADIAAVWDAIREPLANNGLCVMQWPRTVNNGVEIETILVHSSGQFISDTLAMPAKMDAHGIGSAITYGRRYALMAVAGVAPVDDDGNGAADRSGVPGSAGGGTDFRPAGPRQSSAHGRQLAASDPQLATDRLKGTLPKDSDTKDPHAIKMVERSKKAIAYFKDDATTPQAAKDYWSEREDPITEIEAAVPKEYERLLDAYNACLERKPVKAA